MERVGWQESPPRVTAKQRRAGRSLSPTLMKDDKRQNLRLLVRVCSNFQVAQRTRASFPRVAALAAETSPRAPSPLSRTHAPTPSFLLSLLPHPCTKHPRSHDDHHRHHARPPYTATTTATQHIGVVHLPARHCCHCYVHC